MRRGVAVTARVGRAVLLVAILALLASHWVALVLTDLGDGLPLLTLQPTNRPWETWIVLPVAWALVLWAVRRLSARREVTSDDAAPWSIAVGR